MARTRVGDADGSLPAEQGHILELIATGAPLEVVLDAVVRLIESRCDGVIASLLLLDEDGVHLRHGAAPGLPAAYVAVIDGLRIGPDAGSCGTALHRGEPVVVEDIEHDPLWSRYRDVARAAGLRACWSTPIRSASGALLGSFALYWREPRRPQPHHERLVAVATHLGAIAISRARDEAERARLVHSLGERVKELSLLHAAARLLQSPGPLDRRRLEQLVDLIPPGWQHPERCRARIRIGKLEARTAGWRDAPWKLEAGFRIRDGGNASIEVVYLDRLPGDGEDPFLDEERRLVRSLADMLAAHVARDRMETALRARESMFRSIFENAPVGMTLVDERMRFVRCNPAFAHMLGYAPGELDGAPIAGISHPQDMPENERLYRALADGEREHFRMLERYVRKDGSTMWGQLTVSLAPPEERDAYFSIGMVEDVTERKRAESRIEYLATHDELTDLPNRNLIRDRIAQAIPHARRAGTQVAVVFLDLDRFKVVNDAFGHAFGDELLRAVATRLAGVVRAGDTVARQSGDEFLILLSDLRRSSHVYVVVQKLIDALQEPFTVRGRELFVTASVGVSLYPHDGETADALIANADAAMYRAKELGRNTYQFFTRAMGEENLRRVGLETRLRQAAERGELALVYQPRLDLGTGRITGCEALLRWTHPELGAVPPAQFIPIAEESGLIVPIGDWVLRSACEQNLRWQREGLTPVVVSVNLSARQFLQHDVARWALEHLARVGLDPPWLELELTETLIAQDVDAAVETTARLKDAGVGLSIDDFGTGYSSLSQLKRFQLDTLKVDRSFVSELLTDPVAASICRAIISLGHGLGLKVVAEGVESAEQCEFLRSHGCDAIQGFWVSRPLAAPAMAELLRRGAGPFAGVAGPHRGACARPGSSP